jgi:peptidoglycan/xylan/chitin deacetylase (PgdA/CDA1 family)
MLRILAGFVALLPMAGAQVIGVQPNSQALYYWSTTANAFVACPNSSTALASAATPEPIALYGLNAGLNQWTPVTSCPQPGTSYTLPIATTSILGGVKPDGTNCSVNGTTGVLTCAGTSYTLPIATTSILGGVKPDGTNCSVNGTTGVLTCAGTNAGAVLYNLPTTTYAVVGDSNIGSDNHDLSLPITVTAVSCNGTICSVTNSGVNGLAAGDRIDTGWLASPEFLAGGGNCQITGVCLFQVLATGLTTTQFEFAYTLNTGTGTGGTIYTANNYLPFQIMQQPQFKNHGTVFVHPGVIDYLAATGYAAVLHPISPAITGNPGFLILAGDQDRIQNAPCTQAAIKADYQSVWEQAHVDGWKIVQATNKSAAYGLFTCGTKADYDAVEAWKRGQGKSASTTGITQPAGAYWDSLVDVGTVITDNNDGVFTTGANGYFLPGGTAILAPLFNAAMTDNGAVLPKFNCNANGNCPGLDQNSVFTSSNPQLALNGWAADLGFGGAEINSTPTPGNPYADTGELIWHAGAYGYSHVAAMFGYNVPPYPVSDLLPGTRPLCWNPASGGENSQAMPAVCFSIDSTNNYINVGDGSALGDASKSMKMEGLSLGNPLTVANGGTGATTAAVALANLGGVSSVLTTPQTMQSSLAMDTQVASTVGTIDNSCTGWTLGTSWTCGGNGTITLSTGTPTAGPLTYHAPTLQVPGNRVQLVLTATATSGTLIVSQCGVEFPNVVLGTVTAQTSSITCADTSDFEILPGGYSGMTGVVSSVALNLLNGGNITTDTLNVGTTQLPTATDYTLHTASSSPLSTANRTVLSLFEGGAGTEWVTATGTAPVNDTVNTLNGNQTIKVTSTNAVVSRMDKTVSLSLAGTVGIRIDFYVDNVANLGQLSCYIFTDGSNYYAASPNPVNLQASTLFNGWNSITLPIAYFSQTGSPNLATITKFRVGTTSTAGTVVNVSFGGLYAVANPNNQATILISFDDAYESVWSTVRPLMYPYNFPATAFAITSMINKASYMTSAQLKSLQNDFGWDIGCHTESHAALAYLPAAIIDAELRACFAMDDVDNLNRSRSIAYPQGSYNPVVEQEVAKYFYLARSTTSLYNTAVPYLFDPTSYQYNMPACGIDGPPTQTTLAAAEACVDAGIATNSIVPMIFHDIVTTPTNGQQWDTADFTSLMAYIASKGGAVRVITYAQLIKQYFPQASPLVVPVSTTILGTDSTGKLINASGGNIATATALAAAPSTCSTGYAPTGISANGNATGCAALAGGGTITGVTAGTDLTGGGTTGTVTVNVDTTKVPELAASSNKYTNPEYAPGFFPNSGSLGGPTALLDDHFFTCVIVGATPIGSPTGNAFAQSVTNLDANHPGNCLLTSGTVSGAGEASYYGSINSIASLNTAPAYRWSTAVYPSVLPGTTASAYQAGLVHVITANPWTTAIGFYLSSANGVPNDWYCQYGSTYTDSGTAATLAWTMLSLYSDGTKMHWYIGNPGVEVCGTGVTIGSLPTSNMYAGGWSAVTLTGSSSVTLSTNYVLFERSTVP